MSLSKRLRACEDRDGGVDRARCTSLQNPPHRQRRTNATWGSNTPTCSSWDRRALASIRLVEMNEEQKSRSPMATPSITMFGLSDAFIPEGNTSRLWWVNTSHLDTLTKRPRAGSMNLEKTEAPAQWLPWPAKTPSSKYHAWKRLLEQALSSEIVLTRTFNTRENSRGPRGSPCWTPDSEVKQPNVCQRYGCCP